MDLQDKANSISQKTDFHDPKTARRSGASHVPSPPMTIPSTRRKHWRDSGLPLDTRNSMGTPGDVFEGLPARERQPSSYLRKFEAFGIFFSRIKT